MLSFWERLFRQSFWLLKTSGRVLCVVLLPLVLIACSSSKQRRYQAIVSNTLEKTEQPDLRNYQAEENIPKAIRELPSVTIEKTRRVLFVFEEITLSYAATNAWKDGALSIHAVFPKTANSKPRASLFLREGQAGVYYSLFLGSPFCIHLAETLHVPEFPYEPGLPERVDCLRELLRGRYSFKDRPSWFE